MEDQKNVATNGNWKVDAYTDHVELQEVLNSREEQGYVLFQMIECAGRKDREYASLIWRKTPSLQTPTLSLVK